MNHVDVVNLMVADQESIKELQEHRNNPEKIHLLYHRLSSKQMKRLMEFVLVANELNFGQTEIFKDENDTGNYYVELVSKTKIIYPLISRESLLLYALAEAFDCEYHGWGVNKAE